LLADVRVWQLLVDNLITLMVVCEVVLDVLLVETVHQFIIEKQTQLFVGRVKVGMNQNRKNALIKCSLTKLCLF
jgi:hypothetical protein